MRKFIQRFRYYYFRINLFIRNTMHPDEPWLSKDSIKILDQILSKNDFAIEFGSGRSTLWFAKRVKHLISIESDSFWYDKVNNDLIKLGLKCNVEYIFSSNPQNYVTEIDRIADNSIDFCLVDGIERDRCLIAVFPKLKSGGILVLDNCNWYLPNDFTLSPDSKRTTDLFLNTNWEFINIELANWRRIWTSNGVSDTAIFIKK